MLNLGMGSEYLYLQREKTWQPERRRVSGTCALLHALGFHDGIIMSRLLAYPSIISVR